MLLNPSSGFLALAQPIHLKTQPDSQQRNNRKHPAQTERDPATARQPADETLPQLSQQDQQRAECIAGHDFTFGRCAIKRCWPGSTYARAATICSGEIAKKTAAG
jgi:hypothetical protein